MGIARVARTAAAWAALACDPHIVVGADPGDGGAARTPLSVPWQSGFENGLAEWGPLGEGYCYAVPGAALQIVSPPAPVRSGQHAAAFTVNTSSGPTAPSHARCVRQGVLPKAAYYGAWYYVPAPAPSNRDNWNLLHFRGNDVADPASAHGLWDVSLVNGANGSLDNSVYDHLTSQMVDAGPYAIPLGQWFHLEVLLEPAADASGHFTLWRDGQPLVDLPGIATDDSLWGQWFVGNYAAQLLPASSTVYVDDVTISLTRVGP